MEESKAVELHGVDWAGETEIKIPVPEEPKGMMDLTYAEFIERVDEVFPDLEAWQKENLTNWMAFWEEQPTKPKAPVAMVTKMFQAQNLKEETEAALEAERTKKMVHFMSYDAHGSKGGGVYCSCGMSKIHKRGKVLAAWADKHFDKTGHYWKRS